MISNLSKRLFLAKVLIVGVLAQKLFPSGSDASTEHHLELEKGII